MGQDYINMRAFVAVPLGDAVRGVLVRVQEALRRADADVKWVEPHNLHLSIKFLGEIAEDEAERLAALLREETARWPALALEYAGVGTFPERGLPRVVWAGCRGDLEKLAGLARAVERAAEQVGVPRENRPFVAHLTLGRVKSGRNERRLRAAIENQRNVPVGKEEVARLVLYRSTTLPEGPVYEERAAFPLGSSPRSSEIC
jgi:2'-5' RNA ligase